MSSAPVLGQRVAVVTGGASGIGRAVAQMFGEHGAQVVILDREDVLGSTPEGSSAVGVVVDVADSSQVDDAFAEIDRRFGRVDVLANIAGITGRSARSSERLSIQATERVERGLVETPLRVTVELSDADWRRMFAVHVDGTFFCTRAALRLMGKQRSGAIINTVSTAAFDGTPGIAHYCAAKGAIVSFTKSLAKEVAIEGIRVNAVAPGIVDTPMGASRTPIEQAAFVAPVPLQRAATPEEIAAAFLFLASPSASYFCGATLHANGGVLMA